MPITFQDGDILLCKGDSAISRLIKWETDSIYSHVAVIASANLGLVIEAVPEGGVRAISIENYKTDFDTFRVKDENSFVHTDVVAYLVRTLARHYDYPVKLGFQMLVRKLKLVQLFGLKMFNQKKEAKALQDDQDYFCSELCWEAFAADGLDLAPQIGSLDIVSPGDIAASPMLIEVDK